MVQVLNLTASRLDQSGIVSTSTPTRISVSHEIRDFAYCWPRTNQLGAARCYAFQCADILELYCETVLPARRAEPFFIAIFNKDDQPLALFPLSVERLNMTRILRFIDGGLSDLNAPVVFLPTREWDHGTVHLVWQNLRKILPFDLAVFEKMPDRIGDLPNPLILLKTSKDNDSCHAMNLASSWEHFSTKLPRRRTTLRFSRRLEERGRVMFEIAKTPEQYDLVIQSLMDQKTRRYLETRGVDGLARSGYRSFLKTARRLLYPTGPVCLFALKVDDTIIATVWGYVVGSRFYYLMPSFEGGKWRAYSPGRILVDKIVQWCIAHRLDVFDFGLGDEKYKLEYCDAQTALYRAEIPSTVRGRLYVLLYDVKARLKIRMRLKQIKSLFVWMVRTSNRNEERRHRGD